MRWVGSGAELAGGEELAGDGKETYALVERFPLANEDDIALDEIGVQRLEERQQDVAAHEQP